MVAQGQGESAREAYASLLRLDLEDNPGKYLSPQCFQDTNGNLGVAVENRTPLAVKGVRFVVQYQTSGAPQRREQSIAGTIASGSSAAVSTGLGPWTSASDARLKYPLRR